MLGPDEWQHRKKATAKRPAIYTNREGETVTRIVDGACIFLNRTDHPGGAGCAFHAAAVRRGESFIDWKPEVCWQVPVRRVDESDVYGHVTSTVREWKRRDWGPGGLEFHWWCTDSPEAFVGHRPVWQACEDELVAMTSRRAFNLLRDHLRGRADDGATTTAVPHPALRRPQRGRAR
jgi:hypothetical protein